MRNGKSMNKLSSPIKREQHTVGSRHRNFSVKKLLNGWSSNQIERILSPQIVKFAQGSHKDYTSYLAPEVGGQDTLQTAPSSFRHG